MWEGAWILAGQVQRAPTHLEMAVRVLEGIPPGSGAPASGSPAQGPRGNQRRCLFQKQQGPAFLPKRQNRLRARLSESMYCSFLPLFNKYCVSFMCQTLFQALETTPDQTTSLSLKSLAATCSWCSGESPGSKPLVERIVGHVLLCFRALSKTSESHFALIAGPRARNQLPGSSSQPVTDGN